LISVSKFILFDICFKILLVLDLGFESII